MRFDIVADVHGHASKLIALLSKLGYKHKNGTWQHQDRTLISVGDLIDRGPEQLETVDILRRMREEGFAHVTMGNHEHNAIGWSLTDPADSARPLRPHSAKNRKQHEAFLTAVGEGSPLHHELVSWFMTLPLWYENPGLRVIHACWHPREIAIVCPYVDEHGSLTEDGIYASFQKGHPAHNAVEILLKGLEIALPKGVSFFDKDGHERPTPVFIGGMMRPRPTRPRLLSIRKRRLSSPISNSAQMIFSPTTTPPRSSLGTTVFKVSLSSLTGAGCASTTLWPRAAISRPTSGMARLSSFPASWCTSANQMRRSAMAGLLHPGAKETFSSNKRFRSLRSGLTVALKLLRIDCGAAQSALNVG